MLVYFRKFAVVTFVLAFTLLGKQAHAFSCKTTCTKALGADAQVVLTHYLEGRAAITMEDFKSLRVSDEDKDLARCFSCSFNTVKNFLCNLLNKQDDYYKAARIKTLADLFKINSVNLDYFSKEKNVSDYVTYCSKNIHGGKEKLSPRMKEVVELFAKYSHDDNHVK